jgi:ApaG protein
MIAICRYRADSAAASKGPRAGSVGKRDGVCKALKPALLGDPAAYPDAGRRGSALAGAPGGALGSASGNGSDTTTRGLRIAVESEFLPEQSRPRLGPWVFAYHVRIENRGQETMQVVSRHWVITDAHGRVEEVRGPGVVGQQPKLAPGEAFRYTSGCPLPTPMGTMHGSFQVITGGGEHFDARIDPFTLVEPGSMN